MTHDPSITVTIAAAAAAFSTLFIYLFKEIWVTVGEKGPQSPHFSPQICDDRPLNEITERGAAVLQLQSRGEEEFSLWAGLRFGLTQAFLSPTAGPRMLQHLRTGSQYVHGSGLIFHRSLLRL